MAGKLQRNSAGKLMRNALGKIIRSIRCCCGSPPTPGCSVVNDDACETGTAASVTLLVEFDSIVNFPGCTSSGIDDLHENVSGSINTRAHYISLNGQFGATNSGFTNQWAGKFLAAAKTDTAGAIDYELGCIYRGSHYGVIASLTLDSEGNQQVGVVGFPDEPGFGLFVPAWFWNATFETQDAENFCSEGGEFTNTWTSIASGGTVRVTPCPPCAVECDGSPCAVLEQVNCDESDDTSCVGPEPVFHLLGRTSGRTTPNLPNPPAGCVWIYQNNVQGIIDIRTLYIWFDGQDWQGLLTLFGTGSNIENELARTKFAGDIECDDAGMLTGTITLHFIYSILASQTPVSGISYCGNSDCTITVTLGACPGDCFEIDANYNNGDIEWFNNGADFAAGDYEIEYLYGAITYDEDGGQGYRVHASTGIDFFCYSIVDDAGDIIAEAPPQGVSTEYPTEAAHSAAHGGATVTFTHSGGRIGIKLIDAPYLDNALDADGRPPRFKLCAAP